MAGTILTYAQALDRLGEVAKFGIHPSLDGIEALTEALGRPQDAFKSIQVTGTNGKSSTTRVAAAALIANGYRTGTYTSPHLISYTERIEVEGTPIAEDEFARCLGAVLDAAAPLGREFTEFELLTATALHAFREHGVEFACLEVGMGGRWDATSVVTPVVAVITGVALDHTERLGTTREAIAADKACIIKPDCVAILGPGCQGVEQVFRDRAAQVGALVIRVGERDADVTYRILRRARKPGGTLTLQVHAMRQMPPFTLVAPAYQAPNVVCGVAAVGAATWAICDVPALQEHLRALRFPGRFEVLQEQPPLVIDGAHNPDGAATLATAIDEAFGEERPAIVLAVLADKDAEGIVRALGPVAHSFFVTDNGSERCLPPAQLASLVERLTGLPTYVVPDLGDAVARALATGRGVVATGSLYTAGGVRKQWLG